MTARKRAIRSVLSRSDLYEISEAGRWGSQAAELLARRVFSDDERDVFSIHWVVAGSRIREQIAGDHQLVRLLRHLLPPYAGTALTLFRGENLKRWEGGRVGLAWTDQIKVARVFGAGLNAHTPGGVLLQSTFDQSAIISGPNRHSSRLGKAQFTIDPFAGTRIAVLEQFPPCFES